MPPNITSIPVTTATEDAPYEYQVTATDINNDALVYSLLGGPVGMSMNSSGFISWTPANDHVGLHNVTVEVSDGELTDTQEFTIEVVNVNDAPVIISGPITTATQDLLYNYDVEAEDVDYDDIGYSLLENPLGMEIDSDTGFISWMSTNAQVGPNSVKIQASDGELTDVQEFVIEVANVNDAPQIISTPVTTAFEDELYTYSVEAVDVDNDSVTYSLLDGPVGMSMNSNGFVFWTPVNDDVGMHKVTIEVSDGELSNIQSFEINVVNVNDAPEIVSQPIAVAVAELAYSYDIDAIDVDDENIVYTLLEKPEGMEINTMTGVISWSPEKKDAGIYEIRVEVSDTSMASIQEFNLTVFRYVKIDVLIEESTNTSEVKVIMDLDKVDFEVGDTDKDTVIGEIVSRTVLTKEIVTTLADFKKKSKDNSGLNGYGSSGSKKWAGDVFRLVKNADSVINITVTPLIGENAELKITRLDSKPQSLGKDLKKFVYEYLEITGNFNEKDFDGHAEINFKVKKDWMDDNDIHYDDIVLSRNEGEWTDLPTRFVEEKGNYAYYTAMTEGFSYFAITVSDDFVEKARKKAVEENKKEPMGLGKITGFSVKTPFVISGMVYDEDGKTQLSNIPFSIKNMNNREHVEGLTGEANQPGRFSALISGNLGDDVDLILGDSKDKLEQMFKLNDGLEDLAFKLTDQGFVMLAKKRTSRMLPLILITLFICLCVFTKRRWKNFKRFRK